MLSVIKPILPHEQPILPQPYQPAKTAENDILWEQLLSESDPNYLDEFIKVEKKDCKSIYDNRYINLEHHIKQNKSMLKITHKDTKFYYLIYNKKKLLVVVHHNMRYVFDTIDKGRIIQDKYYFYENIGDRFWVSQINNNIFKYDVKLSLLTIELSENLMYFCDLDLNLFRKLVLSSIIDNFEIKDDFMNIKPFDNIELNNKPRIINEPVDNSDEELETIMKHKIILITHHIPVGRIKIHGNLEIKSKCRKAITGKIFSFYFRYRGTKMGFVMYFYPNLLTQTQSFHEPGIFPLGQEPTFIDGKFNFDVYDEFLHGKNKKSLKNIISVFYRKPTNIFDYECKWEWESIVQDFLGDITPKRGYFSNIDIHFAPEKYQINFTYRPIQRGNEMSGESSANVNAQSTNQTEANIKIDYKNDEMILHDENNQLTVVSIETQITNTVTIGYKYAYIKPFEYGTGNPLVLVVLEIPPDAKIVSNVEKNRTNKCTVKELLSLNMEPLGIDKAYGRYITGFVYELGKEIIIDNFDDSTNKCGFGIHFCHSIQELDYWWAADKN